MSNGERKLQALDKARPHVGKPPSGSFLAGRLFIPDKSAASIGGKGDFGERNPAWTIPFSIWLFGKCTTTGRNPSREIAFTQFQ